LFVGSVSRSGRSTIELSPTGYDVVWILKAFATEFQKAELQKTDFGQRSLEFLAEAFKTHEHTGSVGWITESGFEGNERARECREAAGIVQDFIRLAQDTVQLRSSRTAKCRSAEMITELEIRFNPVSRSCTMVSPFQTLSV